MSSSGTIAKGYESEWGRGQVIGAYKAVATLSNDVNHVRDTFIYILKTMGYQEHDAHAWADDIGSLVSDGMFSSI